MNKFLHLVVLLLLSNAIVGQQLNGHLKDVKGNDIPFATIKNETQNKFTRSDEKGLFSISAQSNDKLIVKAFGYDTLVYTVKNDDFNAKSITLELTTKFLQVQEATATAKKLEQFDVGFLPPIRGVQITTGTNQVIELQNLSGAKSTANPREIFAKIPGLNIWESDGAGIQIGIGGRGLSPNRAANFNTRQNGYDISADALGYPESYYTPPFEALKSVEIIRGSASLQFGTQFGGLLNFVIRDIPRNTPIQVTSRLTGGMYGYLGAFNRVTGTIGKFGYQVYHQYKRGNGYRENGNFSQQQLFGQVSYFINEKMTVKLEYTHMDYLARQSGGLTDVQFNENPRQSNRERNWFNVDWNILALHYDYEINSKSHFNIRAFGMVSERNSLGFLGKISQADPGGKRQLISGDFKNAGAEMRYLRRYSLNKKSDALKGAFLVGGRFYQGQTISLEGKGTDSDDANFTFNDPSNLEGSSYDFPSQNMAGFIENILFIQKKITLNMGIRYEYITSEANGYYKKYAIHPFTNDTLSTFVINETNEVQRKVPLFGAGGSYKVGKTSSIYANFTQNYRAINFNDIRINNPNIVIDSLIKDEYGYTAELGFRGIKNKFWVYDLAGFYVFYGDKIGLAPKAGTTYKERTNIGDAVNLGVELFTEFDFFQAFNDSTKQHLSWFVNAAYIHTEYIRSKEKSYLGKQVEYVSPLILRSGIKWRTEKLVFQVQGSYNSSQFSDATNSVLPTGDAVIGEVPPYMVFDFSSRWIISPRWQLEFGINNFTNQQYFTRRATAYPGPGILPSDGINGYLTVQFQFEAKRK